MKRTSGGKSQRPADSLEASKEAKRTRSSGAGGDAPTKSDVFFVRHCRSPTDSELTPAMQREAVKLTPLEAQVLQFRKQVPKDVILFIACGYKYRLFGRDSRVASRRLGIMCIPTEPYESSSIPVQRVGHHAQRLVGMGYTVGIVDQESAALRQEKSGVFERTMGPLLSKGTMQLIRPPEVPRHNGGGGEGDADANMDAGAEGEGEEAEDQTSSSALLSWADVSGERNVLVLTQHRMAPLSTTTSTPSSSSSSSSFVSVAVVSFITGKVYVSDRPYRVSSSVLESVVSISQPVEVVVTDHPDFSVPGVGGGGSSGAQEDAADVFRLLRSYLPLNEGPTDSGREDDKTVPLTVVPGECWEDRPEAPLQWPNKMSSSSATTTSSLPPAVGPSCPAYSLAAAFAAPRELKAALLSFPVHRMSELVTVVDDDKEMDIGTSHIDESNEVKKETQPTAAAVTTPSSQRPMYLPPNTIRNLDILQDSASTATLNAAAAMATLATSGGKRVAAGSLLWFLNRCRTPFGARLLKQWLVRPLTDRVKLEERLDAVSFLSRFSQGKEDELLAETEVTNNSTTQSSGGIGVASILAALKAVSRCFQKSVSDVEATIGRLGMAKCSPSEYVSFLQTILRLTKATTTTTEGTERLTTTTSRSNKTPLNGGEVPQEKSPTSLLERIVVSLTSPRLHAKCLQLSAGMNTDAREPWELYLTSDYSSFLAQADTAPEKLKCLVEERNDIVTQLADFLVRARKSCGVSELSFVTVAGVSYLLEVPSAKEKKVPKEWEVVSRTKAATRFNSPETLKLIQQLAATTERIKQTSAELWNESQFLTWGPCVGSASVGSGRQDDNAKTKTLFYDFVSSLAAIDCLLALSSVAAQPGYSRPRFHDDDVTSTPFHDDGSRTTVGGGGGGGNATSATTKSASSLRLYGLRHPMQAAVNPNYVANDVVLLGGPAGGKSGGGGGGGGGVWVLTGPNMGGKSALVRSIALAVLMAQVGCFVPCSGGAFLPIYTSIYTRMGAADDILEARSTFLTEMAETSEILNAADLSTSLVILDEVGRGTSSFDGVAVAGAVLAKIATSGATTFFITHYPTLCTPYLSLPAPSSTSLRSAATPLSSSSTNGPSDLSSTVGGGGGSGHNVQCKYMSFVALNNGNDNSSKEAAPTPGSGLESAATTTTGDQHQRIAFLYKAVDGVTPSSFGLNIAAAADLPSSLISVADAKSTALQEESAQRTNVTQLVKFLR